MTLGAAAMTLGLPVINDQRPLREVEQPEPQPDARDRDGDANDWRWQLRNRLTSKEDIAARVALTPEEESGLEAAPGNFRVAITPYYFSLVDPERPSCPVRMQVIPRARELDIEPGEESYGVIATRKLPGAASSPASSSGVNAMRAAMSSLLASRLRSCQRQSFGSPSRASGCGAVGSGRSF